MASGYRTVLPARALDFLRRVVKVHAGHVGAQEAGCRESAALAGAEDPRHYVTEGGRVN